MKIDIEIPDITQEQVVEAMAARLLADTYQHDDSDPDNPDPTPRFTWDRKRIGHHLREYFSKQVDELAAQAVRGAFDQVISERIAAAVDEVLAAGWQATNQYGEPNGAKLDLKARVSAMLVETRGDGYNRNPSVLDKQVASAVEAVMGKELKPVVDAAKANLKKCLDEKVMKTVSETIANAVGLR